MRPMFVVGLVMAAVGLAMIATGFVLYLIATAGATAPDAPPPPDPNVERAHGQLMMKQVLRDGGELGWGAIALLCAGVALMFLGRRRKVAATPSA